MIIFFYFSSKPYVVTPHLNRLNETVQMRGHNICFKQSKQKVSLIINNTPSYLALCNLYLVKMDLNIGISFAA